jgi:hypothetical protein
MSFFKRLFIFTLIGVVVSLSALYYANNVLLADVPVSSTNLTADNTQPNKEQKASIPVEVTLPSDSKNVMFFENDKYITYINQGTLYIKDSNSGTIKKEIHENMPIIFYKTIENRGRILYVVKNSNNFELKTFALETEETDSQVKITKNSSSELQAIDYSTLTNNIYVVIKDGSGSDVYKIDIMKKLSKVQSDKAIKTVDMLKKSGDNAFIFENNDGSVTIGSKNFNADGVSKGFKLLGIDDEDNIYILNKTTDTMYTVNNSKVISKTPMKSKEIKEILNLNDGIYAIFSDHIYNVKTKSRIDKSVDGTILSITDSNILYKNKTGKVFIENIK